MADADQHSDEQAEANERYRRRLDDDEKEAERLLQVAKLRVKSANRERLTEDELRCVYYQDTLDDLEKWKPLIKAGRLAEVFYDIRVIISAVSFVVRRARNELEDRLAKLEGSTAYDKLEERVAELEAHESQKIVPLRASVAPVNRPARTKPPRQRRAKR